MGFLSQTKISRNLWIRMALLALCYAHIQHAAGTAAGPGHGRHLKRFKLRKTASRAPTV